MEEIAVDDSGKANSSDIYFRYDEVNEHYIFILNTKGLTIGTYYLSATAENGQSQSVGFLLE